jgi:hypothetical protein
MWSFNVENFKPNLGGILQKRWRSHGLFYLEEKTGKYWQAILTSEPIESPLNHILPRSMITPPSLQEVGLELTPRSF